MKRMKWLYCLIMIIAILHPSNVQAATQPQIVYLGSEVDGQRSYSSYFVSCEFNGDIRINVEFYGGGVYSTIVHCKTKITTPGTITIATLITGAGEEIGPLTPVAIGEPPDSINRTFLPLVAR